MQGHNDKENSPENNDKIVGSSLGNVPEKSYKDEPQMSVGSIASRLIRAS
jgi:hypothetical protein